MSVPDRFRDLVAQGRVGGAILFNRNFESVDGARDLVSVLSTLPSPFPLVIGVDQEGGRVQRLRAPFPEYPPMRAVGSLDKKTVVHRMATVMGKALRALGFHWNYAPVVDVDTNPDNPIIGDRSFSEDPSVVARLGAAFVDGLQSVGIAGCGKHFPGHGDTFLDSHLELPRLQHDLDRLRQTELVPFVSVVRAGVASVMSAHVVFEALDPDVPATLSPKVMSGLLRDEVRFHGLLVTDDLEMKAISDHYGIAQAAVAAVIAGCDQLLICTDVDAQAEAHGALVAAVQEGRLSRERLNEAADRVARFKAEYVVGQDGPLQGPLERILPTSEHRDLLEQLDSLN